MCVLGFVLVSVCVLSCIGFGFGVFSRHFPRILWAVYLVMMV